MNHYERLGVETIADFQALKKAYYQRVKECHPDLFNNSAEKTEEFKLLVAAFDTLSDPDRRKRYDKGIAREPGVSAEEGAFADYGEDSIMDSVADDILEELIVGNDPPEDARIATLFLDLERTLVFMSFREGKNFYSKGRFKQAKALFLKAVNLSPNNILYRCFLARSCFALGQFAQASFHYREALNLGEKRIPPQNLYRIRDELATLRRKRMPWWAATIEFLFGREERPALPPDEEMIRATNRALSRLSKERGSIKTSNLDRKRLSDGESPK